MREDKRKQKTQLSTDAHAIAHIYAEEPLEAAHSRLLQNPHDGDTLSSRHAVPRSLHLILKRIPLPATRTCRKKCMAHHAARPRLTPIRPVLLWTKDKGRSTLPRTSPVHLLRVSGPSSLYPHLFPCPWACLQTMYCSIRS